MMVPVKPVKMKTSNASEALLNNLKIKLVFMHFLKKILTKLLNCFTFEYVRMNSLSFFDTFALGSFDFANLSSV